jgi:hypothetical protein
MSKNKRIHTNHTAHLQRIEQARKNQKNTIKQARRLQKSVAVASQASDAALFLTSAPALH